MVKRDEYGRLIVKKRVRDLKWVQFGLTAFSLTVAVSLGLGIVLSLFLLPSYLLWTYVLN